VDGAKSIDNDSVVLSGVLVTGYTEHVWRFDKRRGTGGSEVGEQSSGKEERPVEVNRKGNEREERARTAKDMMAVGSHRLEP
jgi:hypothetical protein